MLYERLLERTHHVKVWISYARCQHAAPPAEEGPARARAVFHRANRALRSCQEKEQRLMLLEAWRDYEEEFGDDVNLEKVKQLLPRKVTRRRQVAADDGSKMRWEEYVDFVFPDDETAKPSLLLLAKAKEWVKKKQQQEQEQQEGQQTPPLEGDTSEPQPPTDQTNGQEEEPDRDLDRDDSEVDVGSSSDSSSSSDSEDDKKRTEKKRRRRRSSTSSSSSSSSEKGERRERKQQRANTPPRSSSEEKESSSGDRRKQAMDFFT